jgi:hypothetical protein
MNDVPLEVLMNFIVPYVGDHQFRYVAAVNRKFYAAYTSVYNERNTYYNLSSLDHAKLCYEDFRAVGTYEQNSLCARLARMGKLHVIWYLRQSD